jgi:hypothetical protein
MVGREVALEQGVLRALSVALPPVAEGVKVSDTSGVGVAVGGSPEGVTLCVPA